MSLPGKLRQGPLSRGWTRCGRGEAEASLDPTGLSHTEPHSRATCAMV